MLKFCIIVWALIASIFFSEPQKESPVITTETFEAQTEIESESETETEVQVVESAPQEIEGILVTEPSVTNEEIELIALVTMAEAEGECEEGKRLVIDTILNRVDSEHFPDTISEVIYQPNAFTSMWNGRVDKCYVTDDICQLVREELESRTNYEVVFFSAYHYSAYGEPLFQVENHYFSKY